MRAIAVLMSLLLALVPLHARGAAPTPDPLAAGRELSRQFIARDIDALWPRLTADMQAALKSKQDLAAFREQVAAQLGDELTVVDETTTRADGFDVYVRTARYEKGPGLIVMQWAVGADGKAAGFFIRPAQGAPQEPAASAHLDRNTLVALRLPFADEMFVFWGGRTVAQNYHAVDANQRFAYDFLMMRDGASHAGDGRRNEDYYCFGRPILAPAAGRVVEVVDGVEDNVPGQMNAMQVTGNRVVIDHGQGEFSMLAHFRNGSLKVKRDDAVVAGQPLGECGNSGNSSEAHLHYQLQATAEFGTSPGLPAQFVDYESDGKPVARGEPVRGERIRPKAAK